MIHNGQLIIQHGLFRWCYHEQEDGRKQNCYKGYWHNKDLRCDFLSEWKEALENYYRKQTIGLLAASSSLCDKRGINTNLGPSIDAPHISTKIFHMKWIWNIWRKIGMDLDRRMEGSVRWKQSGWTGSRYTHIGKKSPQLFCSTGAKARNILRIQNKKTIHLVWKCKKKVTVKLQTPGNPCSESKSKSAIFHPQKKKHCSQRSCEGSSMNWFLFYMHATQIFHVSWCQTVSSSTSACPP